MKSLGVDVEEYLELYKHSKRKVIGMLLPEALPTDPECASIRTTWTTSINILEQRMSNEHNTGPHRCAYQLLHLFAYFDPLDLDFELLKNARLVNNAPAWVSKVFESKLDLYSTAKILLDLSLIDKTNNSGIYSMHRVVFDWLCTYEAYEIDAELLNTAAAAIAWACPVTYAPLQWAESQQRLILHANVLGQRLPGYGPLVRPFWYDQSSKADLEMAANLWECDTDTLRHSQVYQPIGDIARLISSGGKPQEALALIEDSILHTIDSGPERDIAYYALLYEKALILLDLSLAPDANTALLEALDGFRRLQNPYWIVCSQTLHGSQDPEAETSIRWFQDALATARAADLCVFYCPTWLAFANIDRTLHWHLYDPQRRRVHLESVKEEAERRGYDLHNAQEALRSLASTYVELGVSGAAETLYMKLLEWQVRRYGWDAVEVIPRVQDLAWFFFNQGRAESIEYDTHCLRLVELHYGPASHDTGTAHCFLGESYERHGQLAKAREHFERAWGINQVTKGLAMEEVVLGGLARVCGALEDKQKYVALQNVSSGKKKGLKYGTKVDGGSVSGVSITLDAAL
jgi:tetratricopeptide (TPR) repeat protein